MKLLRLTSMVLCCLLTLSSARAGIVTYDDPAAYTSAAAPMTPEGFETIRWDSWIYDTRLPGRIPALDLIDDPSDPNDGPDYDLDGHFTVTGNSIAYAPADELFKVIRESGNQYLSFSPWYNILWPKTFDPSDTHPIVTFDNFNNADESINAFGLTLLGYTPSATHWMVFELGGQFVPVNLSGSKGDYFVGFVSDSPFDYVRLHTNQNGSSINVDSVTFRPAPAMVPEPASSLVWIGLLASGAVRGIWRRRRADR